jgi:hypothetical protein
MKIKKKEMKGNKKKKKVKNISENYNPLFFFIITLFGLGTRNPIGFV